MRNSPYTAPDPEKDTQLSDDQPGLITLCMGLCFDHHHTRPKPGGDPASMKTFLHSVLDCPTCRFEDIRLGVIDTVVNLINDGALTVEGIARAFKEWKRHEQCRASGKCIHGGR